MARPLNRMLGAKMAICMSSTIRNELGIKAFPSRVSSNFLPILRKNEATYFPPIVMFF